MVRKNNADCLHALSLLYFKLYICIMPPALLSSQIKRAVFRNPSLLLLTSFM